MDFRRLKPEEEKTFLELEREAIYPALSQEVMKEWIEAEGVYAPLVFVLEEKDEIIGGLVFEIQDHFGPEEVLLQLDALFISPEWRRQGFGTCLLDQGICQACDFYQENGLEAIGILIQTTSSNKGAADFYRKFCEQLEFSYQESIAKIGEREISLFLVSF